MLVHPILQTIDDETAIGNMVEMRFFLCMVALARLTLVERFAALSMNFKAPVNCPPCIICPGFCNDARDCGNISRIMIGPDHVLLFFCLELTTAFACTVEIISKSWYFHCGHLGSFDLRCLWGTPEPTQMIAAWFTQSTSTRQKWWHYNMNRYSCQSSMRGR